MDGGGGRREGGRGIGQGQNFLCARNPLHSKRVKLTAQGVRGSLGKSGALESHGVRPLDALSCYTMLPRTQHDTNKDKAALNA